MKKRKINRKRYLAVNEKLAEVFLIKLVSPLSLVIQLSGVDNALDSCLIKHILFKVDSQQCHFVHEFMLNRARLNEA